MIRKPTRYIKNELLLKIRFSEVDAMNVVWHGNYLKFFEDGREALGTDFGLHYLDIAHQGFFVPIVRSEIDHLATVEYGHQIKVTTKLVDTPAAKIIHHYEIENVTTGQLCARGKTIQVFVNHQKQLILNTPQFFIDWKNTLKWENFNQ